jgi:hypothetical protein
VVPMVRDRIRYGRLARLSTLILSRYLGPEVTLVDPPMPQLASTLQLTDADSFGDLPVSSPPSESPSPVPAEQRTEAYELQQHSIEQLFADLESEALEEFILATQQPPASRGGQSAAGSANAWTSQELENILSGEITIDNNATGVSGSTPREDIKSQVVPFSTQRLGYTVEENTCEKDVLLPADDFDDALSIPPPDLAELVEVIQHYEVEEPKTDGRLTEVRAIQCVHVFRADDMQELELSINLSSHTGGSTPGPQLIPSCQCTAPGILNQPVCSLPPTKELPHPSGESAGGASQADLSTTLLTIPAPIVADPSVPDPVPGDSCPDSPAIIDSPNASEISIIPLSFQKVYDFDARQLSSGTSGLFTPAQWSDGGTPVLLEDETAEAPTSLHSDADKSPATPSTPPHAHAEHSSTERLTVVQEDGGSEDHADVTWVSNLVEPSESAVANERSLGVEAVGVDAENPAVDVVQLDNDKSTPTPLDRHAKLILSLPHKVDTTLAKGISPGNPPKESPERPNVLAASGECLPGSRKVIEGDVDADGEADPDYSSAEGNVGEVNLGHAPQPVYEGGRVACRKVSNDASSLTEVFQKSEPLPTR